MSIFKKIEQLKLLHKLIYEENTNTPEMLARKLSMSRANLYILIQDLKKNKLPISYSRRKKSFVYTKIVNINIEFSIEIIDECDDDLTNINGGFYLNALPSNYLIGRSYIFASYLQI